MASRVRARSGCLRTLPGAGGLPSGRKLAREAGKSASRVLSSLMDSVAVRVHHEAVGRQANRRVDDRAPGQFAEPLVRLHEAGHRAGHPGGKGPGDALVGWLPVGVQVHVAGGRAWGRLAVVEGADGPVLLADHHESAAPDVAGLGVHHRQREPDRHGGVHRVATLLQDVPSHFAGDGTSRHHHRLASGHDPRLARQGPRRRDLGRRHRRRRIRRITREAERRGEQGWGEAQSGHEFEWLRGE